MPIDFDFDQGQNLVTIRFHGRITSQEMFEQVAREHGDPRHMAGMNELVLTSEVTLVEASADTVYSLGLQARERSNRMSPIRIAIHAPTDRLFGLARIYTSLTEDSNWETRVFRDLDAARAWLLTTEPGDQANTQNV